ncbi:helix-turn-helix domain-containing protein [Tumebacillus flagellatus]|uniref:HTH cro/C1-type domain-containing protein n=1 Tax=Tumebacillus flagellatus TaxID=1157490 RepID=A0A074LXV2_9BACL|nr:helix-turn-helix transcriptional regulator [Tumebacillus flagellatus]KEO84963.1 hypothetical protein EL26_02895 [Tumebacillus flagellatus]
MSDILMLVGLRVRDLRKQRGYSQEELAEKAGTHFSYIGGIERGQRNVTVKTLEKIAECLDVEVFEFFTNLHHDDEDAEKTELLHQITAILETFGVNGLVSARNILKELSKSQRPDEREGI